MVCVFIEYPCEILRKWNYGRCNIPSCPDVNQIVAGVTLPVDEAIEAKAQVISMKARDKSYADFIVGGGSLKSIEKAHQTSKGGKAAFPLRKAIMAIMDEFEQKGRSVEMNNADIIGVAFSLSGSLDLSLAGEVARMEASICRHALLLRKLVLRYSKALIIFVWTTFVMLIVSAVLAVPSAAWLSDHVKTLAALVIYTCWAVASIYLVRLPLRWIDLLLPDTSDPNDRRFLRRARRKNRQAPFRDPDLAHFENRVTWVFIITVAIATVLAVLSIAAHHFEFMT